MDNCFVINLSSRTDRLHSVQSEFAKLSLHVERFEAIPGGAEGCMKSHVSVIKKAHDLKLETVTIFEDDIDILVTDISYYQKAILELPPTWELLYFGANTTIPLKPYSENLLKARRCKAAHAVMYSKRIYEKILDEYEKGMIKIIDNYLLTRIQPRGESYITKRFCVTQKPDYSDIEKKDVDYSYMEERFLENTETR